MSDTEFAATADTAPAEASAPSGPMSVAPTAAPPPRPAFIPEKFWDGGAGRVRVEDLAKSYRALEQKLGRMAEMRRAETNGTSPHASEPLLPRDPVPDDASPGAPERNAAEAEAADIGAGEHSGEDALDVSVPDSPEGYAVRVSHPWLERDAEIDGLLHAAGFNQAQAQLVYDLAAERVVPAIAGMAAEYEKKMAQGRLEAHFGGPERFAAIARQVKAWGQRHLPPALFETLAATPDGIAALHHMMRAGEPRFLAGDAPAAGPTQDELDTLVRDPRYWRDHQPDLVKRVEEGFRRLYPGA
jgi:hypothetical protein